MGQNWKQIGEIIEKIKALRLSFKDGAKRFGLKPRVLYGFNRRMKLEAKKRTTAKSKPTGHGKARKPAMKVSVAETGQASAKDSSAFPESVKDLIVSYRCENPSHGFKRIQDVLKAKYLLVVSRKHIRRVLKAEGILETCDSSFDKDKGPSAKGGRRFEAAKPGLIWQMDLAYVYLRKIPVLYLVVIIDDHSRFCVAAELCRNAQAETLLAVLHHAIQEYGRPEKLMTDQGSGFYSWSGEQTRFQEYLDDQKIEHLVGEPHSPQTQGKVERLIQTIRQELLQKVKFEDFAEARERIQTFIRHYNFERPHQGIQGRRPVDRLHNLAGEIAQAELELAGRDLDLARGYVVYKVGPHRVCVMQASEGLQVYVDGRLLKETSDGR